MIILPRPFVFTWKRVWGVLGVCRMTLITSFKEFAQRETAKGKFSMIAYFSIKYMREGLKTILSPQSETQASVLHKIIFQPLEATKKNLGKYI